MYGREILVLHPAQGETKPSSLLGEHSGSLITPSDAQLSGRGGNVTSSYTWSYLYRHLNTYRQKSSHKDTLNPVKPEGCRAEPWGWKSQGQPARSHDPTASGTAGARVILGKDRSCLALCFGQLSKEIES